MSVVVHTAFINNIFFQNVALVNLAQKISELVMANMKDMIWEMESVL